ncbi:tetratricopeptide repeat protein [Lentzea tibetensis]|uniref:Tetratricopeptide repeat protein n=1 Tax=Lentzea tibetensis TaxID=2591470 RepID=A0A563EXR5_9PSEU|nr:BTAD domain-containing putative transcriptional regulator [Lentzea tibetensis]TWP52520.1 tetratricopeptide repeat protein [Lentzea tibetensis]
MRVNLLGPVELVSGVGPVPLGAAKRRTVLAALALELNRVVSGDRLMSLVWDGAPPPRAKAALQGHIAQLRKVLGPNLELVTRAPGYLLTGDRSAVDVFAFEDVVAAATREERDEEAVEELTAALKLWRGPFLADVRSAQLADPVSARLDELRLTAVQDMAGRLLRLERAGEAVAGLRQAVDEHPLREPLVARLMLALHRTGRQADAIELFHHTRTRLADELGVDPGPELRAANQSVLTDRPSSPKPLVRNHIAPAQLPREHRGFVGRHDEIANLDEHLTDHDSAIGLLIGPPGVGKTALALRWAHRVAGGFPDGQLFVDLRGFDEADPVDVKSALVGFLRGLGLEDVQIADDVDDLAAQFRSLVATRRVLVVLDNARSVEQVRPLLPGSANCLVLVTSRHGLDDLVVTEGATVVPVHTLCARTAEELLAGGLGRHRVEAEPEAIAELIELCDRLPLALRIAGARLASRPKWTVQSLVDELRDEQGRLEALSLPEAGRGVQAALAVSYRELPEGAARMFRRLGLHPGTDLDCYAAAALLDINAATARTHLRTIAWASLLHESTPDRYSRHDLVRLFTRRLVAHEQDATNTDRLFDYYLHVADTARQHLSENVRPFGRVAHPPVSFPVLSSRESAMDWLAREEANLRLLLDIGDHERVWRLALCLDAFHFQRGNRTERLTVCGIGVRAAQAAGDKHAQANFLLRMGGTLADLGRLDEAVRTCTSAVDFAAGDPQVRCAALANLGYCLLAAGDLDGAGQRMREALEITHETGDVRTRAGVLNNLANIRLAQQNTEEALRYVREALELFRTVPLTKSHVATLHTEGSALRTLGRLNEALQSYLDSLALAEELSDQYQTALCHRAIGDVLEQLGGASVAAAHWRSAMLLYRELGHSAAEELERVVNEQAAQDDHPMP